MGFYNELVTEFAKRKDARKLLRPFTEDLQSFLLRDEAPDPKTTLRYYAANNKERSKEIYTEIMNQTLTKVDYLREMLPQQKL